MATDAYKRYLERCIKEARQRVAYFERRNNTRPAGYADEDWNEWHRALGQSDAYVDALRAYLEINKPAKPCSKPKAGSKSRP